MWSVRCLKVKHQNSSKCELFWLVFFSLWHHGIRMQYPKSSLLPNPGLQTNGVRRPQQRQGRMWTRLAGFQRTQVRLWWKIEDLILNLLQFKRPTTPRCWYLSLGFGWVCGSGLPFHCRWCRETKIFRRAKPKRCWSTRTHGARCRFFPLEFSSEVQPNAFQVKQTKPSKGGCKLEAKKQNSWVFRKCCGNIPNSNEMRC